MRKVVIAALVAVLTFAAPFRAFAQTSSGTTPVPSSTGGPVAVGQAQAQVDPGNGKVSIVVAPPVADTTVSFGSLGGEILAWFGAVFIPVVGAFAVRAFQAVAQRAGIQVSQAASDRLDQMIENGLHAGLDKAGADLTGKLTVDVKNKALADAVTYAQDHGADTIKTLIGVDPNDPKVVEALQARATKALNNVVAAAAPAAA